MCVNNLPRVAFDSGEARIRTHNLLIATTHILKWSMLKYMHILFKQETIVSYCKQTVCRHFHTKITRAGVIDPVVFSLI